jgi:hypothetical protein
MTNDQGLKTNDWPSHRVESWPVICDEFLVIRYPSSVFKPARGKLFPTLVRTRRTLRLLRATNDIQSQLGPPLQLIVLDADLVMPTA